MSNYRLDKLFSPRSVALVGASLRPGALGHAVLANLRRANPSNPPWLVNPGHAEIEGLECRKSLLDLAASPDLVVIAVPPEGVVEVAKQACSIGAAAAIVITAELGHGEGSLAEDLRCVARAGGLRIVGPNCIGVLSPRAGLDASFLAKPARAGNLAVVSQSGAIVAALVEWADVNRVGFSGVVSLGDQIDVDFGDCLDHFALDDRTGAILLYIEAISDARKFLSAARAAARVKPVIVVKGGRHSEGARAALSHTGALAGSDAVYDAAFRRAGLPRVMDLEELFAAAETLAGGARMQGERVGILTNGGGIGVLAVDRLIDFGGRLAPISPKTVAALDACLPKTWSRANPVDIIGDADFPRYAAALDIMLAGDDFDAVLVINCPTARAPNAGALRSRQNPYSRFGSASASARRLFSKRRVFPISTTKGTQCAASCIWSTSGVRSRRCSPRRRASPRLFAPMSTRSGQSSRRRSPRGARGSIRSRRRRRWRPTLFLSPPIEKPLARRRRKPWRPCCAPRIRRWR